MAKHGNRVRVSTATTGTGTVTLGAATSNSFCTFAEAGIANGDSVTYIIEDGSDFEIGRGTYTSSGTTLSRDTVLLSKIGGTSGTSKINLSGAAVVRIEFSMEDIGIFPRYVVKSGFLAPSQITSNQNDYAPTGLLTSHYVHINADQDGRIITGLTAGVDGQEITFYNNGSTVIIFSEENTGSSAANRFSFNRGSLHLVEGESATFRYSGTLTRWLLKSATMYPVYRRVLAADEVNNNAVANTLEDITGLKFPIEANRDYNAELKCCYTAAATTTGSRWTFNGPASPTAVYMRRVSALTATTETSTYVADYQLPSASGASSLTTGNVAIVEMFVRNGSNAGDVQAQFASEVANSAITALAKMCTVEWSDIT